MAKSKICAVDGCGKQVRSKGLCSPHYRRLLRHGDPLKGNAAHGSGLRWIEQHVGYSGDDCLIWPFGVSGTGYPLVRVKPGNPSMQTASRAMCELAHGPPPAGWYEAAHSCGNGHIACVNPKHLRWATPSENRGDKRLHGTLMVGDSHPSTKLSDADVAYIRSMKGKILLRSLADQFCVSRSLISSILSGRQR